MEIIGFILLLCLVVVIIIIMAVFGAIFSLKQKITQFFSGGDDSSDAQSRGFDRQQSHATGHGADRQEEGKIFSSDEGEYVDFEEIKD